MMTHSPPIPAGNQSPYPIQEPPHHHDAVPAQARDGGADRGRSGGAMPDARTMIGAAVVAGIGAAAAAAAYFLAVREAPKPRCKPRQRTGKA